MKSLIEQVGRKDDDGKSRWVLMPWGQLEHVQDVLDHGAKKYEEWNWQLVPRPHTRYLSAAMRHVIAYMKGESTDKDSGLPHLAHAVCCLLFIMWFDDHGKGAE